MSRIKRKLSTSSEEDVEEDVEEEDVEDIEDINPLRDEKEKETNTENQSPKKIIELKFNSQWTGTCKNIEMYSEELQERKNQLEIDIGLKED